jgi:beta-glucosidase
MIKPNFSTKLLFILLPWTLSASAQKISNQRIGKAIDQRVDSLLKLMTLDEKVGQLNQYSGEWSHTGPITKDGDKQNQVRNGQLGSMLNVIGLQHKKNCRKWPCSQG